MIPLRDIAENINPGPQSRLAIVVNGHAYDLDPVAQSHFKNVILNESSNTDLYMDLLLQVESKNIGESRHQAAKRLIKAAQSNTAEAEHVQDEASGD